MNRREFLKSVAVGYPAALALLSSNTGGISTMKPNILFLFTDDQRFNTLNVLGNSDIATPNIDSLVNNGTTFTHATIMGSMNGAVCMPSRAMLMSGRTLFRAPDDLANTPTFPETFKNAGYNTFGIGKWHNQPSSYARSFTDGAKIFYGGMSDHLEVPVSDFDPSGQYPKEKRYIGEKFSSELFSDAAVKFLREYEKDDPFMLYVSYTAPHDPRTPPIKYKEMYNPKNIPIPENFMPQHPFDNGEMVIRDEKLAPFPRTQETIQQHIADYYGMISHLDDEIGRILETLRGTGYADNTIIIFAGDNGLAVGQHGLMGKQNMYEHSVRVPLIFTGPGIPKGKKTDSLCYLLDIFPTISEMTGVTAPETVEGQSLAPIITGKQDKCRDSLYFAYKDIQRAVRDRRFKLIEYFVGNNRETQLFDLNNDPYEINNLAKAPEYSSQLIWLKEELAKWQKEVNDPI